MAEVHDAARLAALASYDILDTLPEEGFDDAVLLAKQMCDAPVALVSLVAADRQWFKARSGFPLRETDLDSSVCAHALAEPDLLVVPDLTRDPRTANNPLVLGDPCIRFYAGAPLRTAGGDVLGTLCVIDTVPRPAGLTDAQADGLRRLARQVVSLLELRRAVVQRDAALSRQEILVRQHRALLDTQQAVGDAAGDLDAVFAALVAGAMRAVPAADGGVVELIDGDDLVYHSPQGAIRDRAGSRIPLRSSLAGRSALAGQPCCVPDVRVEDGVSQDLLARLGVRSCLLVPLVRAAAVIGVLKLQSGQPGAFGEEDLQVARLFAGEAVAGLAGIGEVEARKAARASENRYRSVFDSITDFALIATDRDGRVTEWNTGAERILGWSTTEMRGHEVDRIFTPEDRAGARARREMALSVEQGRASDERWHLRRDGGRFWASGEMMPLRDEDGIHRGYVKVMRDRTAEHLAGKALDETEARLRESEDHYRHTVELNPAVPWTCDPQGNITSHSRRWLELTGQKAGEPVGNGWLKAVHQDDVARTLEAFSASLASGDPIDVDYRIHIAATGAYRWMRARAHPRRDAGGRIMRWYGVVEDIQDRKLAEAALRRGEERFRTIFETIETAFALVEVRFDAADQPVDYRFLEINPAFERQTGVNLRGQWVTEFAPDLEPFWFETYGHVARTGEPANVESYAEAFGRWFDVRAVRVGEPADRQIAIFFSDVTARHEAEDRLRASEALALANIERVQLALAAGAILGTWHWDLPTDCFTVDEGFARSFGLDPALGRTGIPLAQIVATVHPDDQADLGAAIDEAIARGGAYAHQYRVRRADRLYYWIEANGRVDHGPDGTPLSFPGVLLDVDKRRAVEQERDRAAAALRALNETLEQRVSERTAELMRTEEALRQSQKMEAVGQLTGGIAHDFNNLLTAITGGLDLLQMRLTQGRTADATRYIDMAQGAAKRAAALTHRLLAFSRRQTLAPKSTDVNRLVAELEDLIRRTVGPAIRVETVMAAGLWNTLVDPGQLENAVLNLCINARDAMPDGGAIVIETGNVSFDRAGAASGDLPPGRYVTVSVSDDGLGMPPDVVARAFDPFFTTKPIGQGTGLGLSMIYGFSRQSGGQVRIYSEVGQGTRVCLYLPRHAGEAELDPLADGSAELPRARQGETVLVVDDETSVRMLVRDVLGDLGYGALEAADGAAGLEILRTDARIDLLVTDVGLPGGMNGRQVADAARELRPGLRVLFITGYAENAVLSHGHLDPGMHILTKPFAIDALAEKMRALIEG